MAREDRTDDLAYQKIRRALLAGEFELRRPLHPRVLGAKLGVSPTPVREALMRLAGERLIRLDRGFFVPFPSAAELAALYQWRGALLALALQTPPPSYETGGPASQTYAERAVRLFRRIESASNLELRTSGANADDRLHLARQAEADIFANADSELEHVVSVLNTAPRAKAVASLRAYHERRIASARAIRERLAFRLLGENGD